MNIKVVLSLSFILLLQSCGTFQSKDWSESYPPQEFFLESYQVDTANQEYQSEEDYLYWVKRFYNGINIVPGWLGITEQVLEKLEEPQRSEVEMRLYSLGLRIGAEWPKDDRVRLLNTRSASVWREALLESLDRGELDEYLDILEQDVDDLLAGKLENDDVYFERYYEDEY